jgi:hypothetical protein
MADESCSSRVPARAANRCMVRPSGNPFETSRFDALTEHAVAAAIERDFRQRKVGVGDGLAVELHVVAARAHDRCRCVCIHGQAPQAQIELGRILKMNRRYALIALDRHHECADFPGCHLALITRIAQ